MEGQQVRGQRCRASTWSALPREPDRRAKQHLTVRYDEAEILQPNSSSPWSQRVARLRFSCLSAERSQSETKWSWWGWAGGTA